METELERLRKELRHSENRAGSARMEKPRREV